MAIQVEAEVSESLPVSVFLGTEVPELLQSNPRAVHTEEVDLVVTRAHSKRDEEEERE